ncbi:MAG TPA: sulfite exporter TauE/SafE family protein [Acidimicrobiales bacterium]|nr:sulfite exporter TauE/SafE family protein [Acidimicrobiales bacterium]
MLLLPAAVALTPGKDLLIAMAGVGAGVVNGVAGGGTLVSFPTLLALGYSPLTANVTSTIGIWPGYVSGVAGFRAEVADQRTTALRLAVPAVLGAVVGAALLLTTPSTTFSALAPWLVLFAAALFALQPLVLRLVGEADPHHGTRRVLLEGGTFLASVYGGYFGAGLGVILLAVLGVALPDTLVRSSGLRSALSVVVNGVAAAVFLLRGSPAWMAVAMLAVGSLAGGYLGALAARRVPAPALRVVIVLIGLATGIKLLVS